MINAKVYAPLRKAFSNFSRATIFPQAIQGWRRFLGGREGDEGDLNVYSVLLRFTITVSSSLIREIEQIWT